MAKFVRRRHAHIQRQYEMVRQGDGDYGNSSAIQTAIHEHECCCYLEGLALDSLPSELIGWVSRARWNSL